MKPTHHHIVCDVYLKVGHICIWERASKMFLLTSPNFTIQMIANNAQNNVFSRHQALLSTNKLKIFNGHIVVLLATLCLYLELFKICLSFVL